MKLLTTTTTTKFSWSCTCDDDDDDEYEIRVLRRSRSPQVEQLRKLITEQPRVLGVLIGRLWSPLWVQVVTVPGNSISRRRPAPSPT